MPIHLHLARLLFDHARMRVVVLGQARDSERGASAVEWAIISAIVVAAAVLIGVAIMNVINEKVPEIEKG